jgi:hypothetical protein
VQLFCSFAVLYVMKKSITILIAGVLLAFGMQVSVDRHYCGGTLADVKISVTGKMASCGMEQIQPLCQNYPVIDKKCCEDHIVFYSITSKYFPEFFKLTHPIRAKNIIATLSSNFITAGSYNTDLMSRVLHPGDNLRSRLTQPGICIFRI